MNKTPQNEAQSPSDLLPLEATRLRLGAIVLNPIFDEHEVLLLGKGQEVTQSFLENLIQRGIQTLKVHAHDLPRLVAAEPQGTADQVPTELHSGGMVSETNPQTESLDQVLMVAGALDLPPQGRAVAQDLQHRTGSYENRLKQQFVEQRENNVQDLKQVFDGFLNGLGVKVEQLADMTDGALDQICDDLDLFATLGINPHSNDYPVRHSLQTAMSALCMGTKLQLDRSTLRELGMGCLIHDAGMLKIDQRLLRQPRKLTRIKFLEISKHPVRIFDQARNLERIPQRAAFIAYQMHERNNGSGYPRQKLGTQIHFLSKVAAVADVYTALVTPRPHRPAILPHRAIEYVVDQGNQGLLDAAAVRALLLTTSMYPLGSYVLLNDQRVARTIRANDKEFDRPVVEAWPIGKTDRLPEVVDLQAVSDVYILQPIPRLDISLAELQQTPHDHKSRITQLLDMLDLIENANPEEFSDIRRSVRRTYRNNIVVLYQRMDEGQQNWHTVVLQARNLSSHGVGLVGQVDQIPNEVVVVLSNETMKPLHFRSTIKRRESLGDGWWELGVEFQERVQNPLPAAGHAPRQ